MQNLLEELKELLQQDNRFVVEGKLLKNKIIEASLQLDSSLIKMLISNDNIKRHFFQEVDKVLIFDKIKFQKFINNKTFLPDSYTSFRNNIGLLTGENFISESKDVVLGWPYKDCVLEGGQTKESLGREEIFWNETLAPDDIDRLYKPKVLTNFKKYTQNGEEIVDEIKADDNLIIKGNNLLVLHSLKQKFAGRIKVIYLDPPYNTESDGFRYNDNFSQSTWLTFMKNRIEVAKELLSSEGFLFVHISFHQFAYLQVLLDEIFKGNRVCTFNLLVRHPNRILKADKDFHDVVEYLLVYTKNKVANKIAKRKEATDIDDYLYTIEELSKGKTIEINGNNIEYFLPEEYKITKGTPSNDNLQKISIRGSLKEGNSSGRFYEKHLAPLKSKFPPNTLFKIPNMGKDKFDYRYFYTPDKGSFNGGYFQGVPIDSKEFKEKPYANFLDLVQSFNNVGYEGDVEFRNGKKPESLIKKVFEFGKVQQGDIVLDFFLGSGTTSAVAHKMGIQYIGIEQMDYGENDSVKRLNSVIQGDEYGISEEVKWKGGGSFIYCELEKLNEAIIDKIQRVKKDEDLFKILDLIMEKGFLNYDVNGDALKQNLKLDENLTLNDKKKVLIDVLDKNQLYLNYSEINDKDFSIPENIKKINNIFYKKY